MVPTQYFSLDLYPICTLTTRKGTAEGDYSGRHFALALRLMGFGANIPISGEVLAREAHFVPANLPPK